MSKPTKSAIARELAEKIDVYLKRFERSATLNPGKRYDKARQAWVPDAMGVRDFYGAHAWGDRHRVGIKYVSYQGGSHLSTDEATLYLAWLEAGNVGRHYQALK